MYGNLIKYDILKLSQLLPDNNQSKQGSAQIKIMGPDLNVLLISLNDNLMITLKINTETPKQ